MKRTMTFLALLLVMCLAAGSLSACSEKTGGKETTEAEEPTSRRQRGTKEARTEEETESESGQAPEGTSEEAPSPQSSESPEETPAPETPAPETPENTEPETPEPGTADTAGTEEPPATGTGDAPESGTSPEGPAGTSGEPEYTFTGDWDDYVWDVLIPEGGLVAESQRGPVTENGMLFGMPDDDDHPTWFDGNGLYAWEEADVDGDGEEDLIAVVGGTAQAKLSNHLRPGGGQYRLTVVLFRQRNGKVMESIMPLMFGFDSVAPADIVIHLVNAGGIPQILVFQDNIWFDGQVEDTVRQAHLWLLEAAPDTDLHYVYGLRAELTGSTNDVPLYEITYDKDYYNVNPYPADKSTSTQVETKLRAGNLDIRAGVPLSVYRDMMDTYLQTRHVRVDDEFEPLTDADGEDILRISIGTDGTDAWCELER